MSDKLKANRTYKDFPEALRELMEARNFSFPKLAREIGRQLSTTYLHNLASGKSRPTEENIEVIARGLKVNPSYFKEYREYQAKHEIDRNPNIADLVLDKETIKLTAEFANLSNEEKKQVSQLIKEIKSRYRTRRDSKHW